MEDRPFYAEVILQTFRVQMPEYPFPAAVRIRNGQIELLWNPKIFGKLSLVHRATILEHETLHLIFGHLERRQDRDALVELGVDVFLLWNVAADLAVNSLLKSALFQGALLPAQFDLEPRKTAEYYYDQLQIRCRTNSWKLASSWDERTVVDSEDRPDLINGHLEWDYSVDSDIERRERAEVMRRVVENTSQRCPAGLVPASVAVRIKDLLTIDPVNWRTILARDIGSATRTSWHPTWSRVNRRFPGLTKGRKPVRRLDMAIALDTSGSIDMTHLELFLSTVMQLRQAYPSSVITVFECDYIIRRVYTLGNSIARAVKGRMYTDFKPVFEAIEQRRLDINLLLYLTDLHGPFPEIPPRRYKVLWVRTPDSDVMRVPFGRLVILPGSKR